MKTIMRKFRRFILKKAAECCDWRVRLLDIKTNRYHEIIIKKIKKGENKLKIERLKVKRDRIYEEKYRLIALEGQFRIKLIRA